MPDLNSITAYSIVLLTICTVGILIVLIVIGVQLNKTLNSANSLISLIQNDLEPTVKEFKEGVANVKNVFKKCATPLNSVLEKARVTLTSVVHGIETGVKSYFGSDNTETTDGKTTKQDIEI